MDEKQRIAEILDSLHVADKSLSWLESLAPISDGKLLAKILHKLEEQDLNVMCRASKLINSVCKRYQLHKRLYAGKVYMFGDDRLGILGSGEEAVPIPRNIKNIPAVKIVSCGHQHTGLVTVAGEVYVFGDGAGGPLGDGQISPHYVKMPQKIQNIPPVKTISCGHTITGIVTDTGEVYMSGMGDNGCLGDGDTSKHSVGTPQKIQNIPPVSIISCAEFFTGIVTVFGDVYMFGHGGNGLLGDGDMTFHNVGIPKKIQNVPPVSNISCGRFHTGIVTVSGDVYMFGDGKDGKLGDGATNFHDVGIPKKIQNIPPVKAISCGRHHTGLVTISGEVYMFGNGDDGKLGDGDPTYHVVGIPKKIQNIPPVRTISCGVYNTGILTLASEVYMLGNGTYGMLGDGDTSRHAVAIPQKIENIPPMASISCGTGHTGLVTIPESSLDLTIDCQYCGIKEALYFDCNKVFCSKQCQILEYNK